MASDSLSPSYPVSGSVDGFCPGGKTHCLAICLNSSPPHLLRMSSAPLPLWLRSGQCKDSADDPFTGHVDRVVKL